MSFQFKNGITTILIKFSQFRQWQEIPMQKIAVLDKYSDDRSVPQNDHLICSFLPFPSSLHRIVPQNEPEKCTIMTSICRCRAMWNVSLYFPRAPVLPAYKRNWWSLRKLQNPLSVTRYESRDSCCKTGGREISLHPALLCRCRLPHDF